MKKFLSVFLVIVLMLTVMPLGVFSFSASAETATSGVSGDCVWSLSGTVLTISGTGEMADYDSGWGTDITQIIIKHGVTSIGYMAFSDCKFLTSITIPESVTTIEGCAFMNCTALTSAIIPNSVTSIDSSLFSGCTSLTRITIPDSIISIGSSAFSGCTSLTKVEIPDSVTNIGSYAFHGCTGIASVKLPEGITSIGSAFAECTGITSVTMPNSITSIEHDAFRNCVGLTSITIPESVTSIGGMAFRGCTGLTSIKIPNGVTSIGEHAFSRCNSLQSVHIPKSVTRIFYGAFAECHGFDLYVEDLTAWFNINFDGSDANPLQYAEKFYLNNQLVTELVIPEGVTTLKSFVFSNLDSLVNISIPDAVTSIENAAFYNCKKLTSITIPENVTTIEGQAFDICPGLESIRVDEGNTIYHSSGDCLIETSTNTLLLGCKNSTIPDTVTKIGSDAFYGCVGLKNIIIPDSITSIDSSAFSSCTGLTSVVISDNVTSIGWSAFSGCTSLTSVVIPDNVTSIGWSAFKGCTSLKDVTIGTNVTSIGAYGFADCTSLETINFNAKNCTDVLDSYSQGTVFVGCDNFQLNIGNIVERIPVGLFEDSTGLKGVTVGRGVTSISAFVFEGCTGLESIRVDEENAIYHSSGDCLIETSTNTLLLGCKNSIIPDTVTKIGGYAFYGCVGLKNIFIPDSITSIDSSAFIYCTELESIKVDNNNAIYYSSGNCLIETATNDLILGCKNSIIPDTVTRIGFDAFYGCKELKNITIPNGVIYIDDCAFLGCTGLTSITIPNSVTDIGKSAFNDCTGLKDVTIGSSVTSIGDYAFYGCTGLESVVIPDSVIKIGQDTFCACTGLKEVTIGSGIESIDFYAFRGCSNLTTVNFNAINCKRMDLNGYNFVFVNCDNLKTVNIGDNVTTIPRNAFNGCHTIRSITIPDTVARIENAAFKDCYIQDVWYYGSETEREDIYIGTSNEWLSSATWHYNNCNAHEYSAELNFGHTCIKCKYSKEAIPPTLESTTISSITLSAIDGFEYSKDCILWQENNTFTGLSPNTSYIFYQRVKATENAVVGIASQGITATTKLTQTVYPNSPIVYSYTDTTVTLIDIENCEYSKDGIIWQDNNIFIGLLPVTKYTFYQRYVENETYGPSEKSAGVSITTDKSKQTLIPDAPTVQSFTASSITLNVIDDCEYSKDGSAWQSSNVFSGLLCGTEYTFYQRFKETTTTYAGKSSAVLKAKTDKGTQTAPSAPTLSDKTHNSITLTAISGYEYSRDGINWQESNLFTGLSPETNYIFYQRKTATDKYYVSASSSSLTVKTNEQPIYTSGDLTGDGKINSLDGLMLLRYLNGWNITIASPEAMDVNADGKINSLDGLMLTRYLNGWNITLG